MTSTDSSATASPPPRSRPMTRHEIATRAKADPSFKEGLLVAAELIRGLAEGRTNV